MAVPVANFNFYANNLVVAFEDLTTNIPTSWAWDFGDAGTAITQNPSHTYAAAGTYTVKLTATNASGNNSFSYKIVVATTPILNQTIETMVGEELPTGFDIAPIELTQAVRKWQIYLQPMVYIPFTVAVADIFTQAKWPALVNVLIAKLVIYEQLLASSSKTMLGMTQVSSSGSSGGGGLKRIESGPSVAEWHDPAAFWSTLFKGSTSDGFFAMMSSEICLFARRQNIMLPTICGKKMVSNLFGVSKKTQTFWPCWPPSKSYP